MGKDKEKLEKLTNIPREFGKAGPCILWNMEQSEEMHGNDYCIDFHFFVKYKNPENILDKIDKLFDERTFKSPLTKKEHSRGHIGGTVNDYVLITYTTLIGPENMSFSWTGIPVKLDKNFSKDYKKAGSLEEYISRFINN